MKRTPDTLAVIILLVGLALACARLTLGCAESLTPIEKETIARDGVLIGVCQSKGRECKRTDGGDCFGVYDDCMLDGGLREASAR